MTADLIAFGMVSLLTVLSVVFMIRSRKLMHSAVYLALFFLFSSGILAILGAVFLAIMQVFVFTGGMVVLIVMVIMMSGQNEENTVVKEMRSLKFITLVVLFALTVFLFQPPTQGNLAAFSIGEFGTALVNNYSMAVVAATMMLFAAIVSSSYFLRGDKE